MTKLNIHREPHKLAQELLAENAKLSKQLKTARIISYAKTVLLAIIVASLYLSRR